MKKAAIFTAIVFIINSWMFAQKNDTTIITGEVEDTSFVIVSDDDEGVAIDMEEVIKEEKRDTTRFKLGDKNIAIIEDDEGTNVEIRDAEKKDDEEKEAPKKKKFKGHWSGVEIGLNNFFDSDFSMSRSPDAGYMDLNTGRSWNCNLNIHQMSFGLVGNRFGLVTGLGFEFNNYQFDGDNSIQEVNGVIQMQDLSAFSLTKSKLTTTFLNIPVLLEVQIGPQKRSKRIHISGGIIGGLKLGSHTKYVYRDEGRKEKVKNRDDFNINPLRYGFTLRTGYRQVELYANYYPVPFFEKDKGPELYPFNVGLSLGF
ncbi:MAG: outer membrane beta-barrel protein [Bacteroidales bacterium]|nr:outer membrane beta-barrel protein [Bacteroidales bacterium]